MKNKSINQKIIDLWNKYFKDSPDACAPIFYDEFKNGGLLFVGMNPSFSARGFKSFLKNTEYAAIDPESFLSWKNVSENPNAVHDCICIENYARMNYPLYFKRPIEIAKNIGLSWQHIDLFLYRETSQSGFMQRILEKGILNNFALDQISIFEEILTQIEPDCIIVANAYVSEILRDRLKNRLTWDNQKGVHLLEITARKVPIFFSSMLSGQRALDRWSYERLVWHIRQTLVAYPSK